MVYMSEDCFLLIFYKFSRRGKNLIMLEIVEWSWLLINVVFFGCFIYVKVFSFFGFYILYVLMYIIMIIRMFFNILIFYVWCYIINELLLVIIINNFVLMKIVCIYSEEFNEMVYESSFWKNIDVKLL